MDLDPQCVCVCVFVGISCGKRATQYGDTRVSRLNYFLEWFEFIEFLLCTDSTGKCFENTFRP